MKAARLSLALIALIALPGQSPAHAAAGSSAADAGELAYRYLHATRTAYEVARATAHGDDVAGERMLVALFSVRAGAAVFFDQVEGSDVSRRRIEETLLILSVLTDEAEGALRDAKLYDAVAGPWREARGALDELLHHFGLAAGRALPPAARTGASGVGTAPPEPTGPTARITATDWLGGFTPDLELRGVFEGRRLARAELEVHAGERVTFRDETELTHQIQAAMEKIQAGEVVRVDWSIRIDDKDLGSGENRIIVTLHDADGRTAETEITLKKRLF